MPDPNGPEAREHEQLLARAPHHPIPLTPLPAEAVEAGSPATGASELGELGGCRIGLWEITPGVSRDVEADEVFVVLDGTARIDFLDPAGDGGATPRALHIAPGDVVRLRAGQRTRWTVHETLRKVYLLPGE